MVEPCPGCYYKLKFHQWLALQSNKQPFSNVSNIDLNKVSFFTKLNLGYLDISKVKNIYLVFVHFILWLGKSVVAIVNNNSDIFSK